MKGGRRCKTETKFSNLTLPSRILYIASYNKMKANHNVHVLPPVKEKSFIIIQRYWKTSVEAKQKQSFQVHTLPSRILYSTKIRKSTVTNESEVYRFCLSRVAFDTLQM